MFDSADAGLAVLAAGARNKLAVRLAVRAARCVQNEVPAIADALQEPDTAWVFLGEAHGFSCWFLVQK